MKDIRFKRNHELFNAYQAGDKAAYELLILENSRLVSSIARRYTFNFRFEYDDLVQEGYIGLMTAIKKYNPNLNVPFGNYATYWIKQAILRYIYNKGSIIRLPLYIHEKIFLLKKAIETLTVKNGKDPTSFELAKYLNMNIFEVEKLLQLKEDVESLDEPIADDDEFTRLNLIKDEQETPEDIAERNDRIRQVQKAVMKLNERQREVICRHYGIKRKPETLSTIGKSMNLSTERIRQIERKAFNKLRALPELKVYRIEQKLDERTNFYRQTEKVVLWREQHRRQLYKQALENDYNLSLSDN